MITVISFAKTKRKLMHKTIKTNVMCSKDQVEVIMQAASMGKNYEFHF